MSPKMRRSFRKINFVMIIIITRSLHPILSASQNYLEASRDKEKTLWALSTTMSWSKKLHSVALIGVHRFQKCNPPAAIDPTLNSRINFFRHIGFLLSSRYFWGISFSKVLCRCHHGGTWGKYALICAWYIYRCSLNPQSTGLNSAVIRVIRFEKIMT